LGFQMVDPAVKQLKPHCTFEQQLTLLKERGLQVADDALALKVLERLGYYRLSGYFYPLRRTNPVGEPGRQDQFQDGASFELVVELADFDKKLRLLSLYALETIEVAVRVAVAHRLGKVHAEAHLDSKYLDGKFTKVYPNQNQSAYNDWRQRFRTACEGAKDDFVQHHRTNYGGRMPVWVAVELWDFGLLSRFFAGMQVRDQSVIAHQYGLSDGLVLKSWMRTFNFVRNVAAHHSRLWNRTLPDTPVLPPLERCRWIEVLHKDPRAHSKMFGALTCMRLMVRAIAPHSDWHQLMKAHICTFPPNDHIKIESAGFPIGWESLPIWAD